MSVGLIAAMIVAGLLLVFAEGFIPGGVLGVVGGILLLVGVGGAFGHSVLWGSVLFVGVVIFGGVGFYYWITYFPSSRMGRKLILDTNGKDWHSFDDTAQDLLGKEGVAHSKLRPVGTAIIEGKRLDVMTRGEMIERRAAIRVIDVEGNKVTVVRA